MRGTLAALLVLACSQTEPAHPYDALSDGITDGGAEGRTDGEDCLMPSTAEPFTEVTDLWFEKDALVHHGDSDFCEWPELLGPGVCVFDYDGDRDPDIYLVDVIGHANRLYRNDGGTFEDVTNEAGVGDTGNGLGCLAFDYDSDADLDLYLTNDGLDRLYRNDDGIFSDVTIAVGLVVEQLSSTATAADIEGDGDADLFVGAFVAEGPVLSCPLAPPLYEPLLNQLLINEGGEFVDAAESRGLVHRDPTLAALFVDWDSDGDPDLWVGNDSGFLYPDRMYMNDGTGHFSEEAAVRGLAWAAGGTHSGCTMGVDVGDFDGDGAHDLVSSNFLGQPTLLFDCDAAGFCEEIGISRGLGPSVAFKSWGVLFEDFDFDGDLDLFSASGTFFPESRNQRNELYWNEDGFFLPHEPSDDEALALARSSRGVGLGDFDGDGDGDLVVASTGDRAQVLRNDAPVGHWLAIRPVPAVAGTRITAATLERTLTEQLLFGGYLGSSEPVLRFGLGAARVAHILVEWPDGTVVSLDDVAVDQRLTITRGGVITLEQQN